MFSQGNVVILNDRGKLHHDKKYYKKRIHKDRMMIVISSFMYKNKVRYLLRDSFSDFTDKYFEFHLEFKYKNMREARFELLGY